jgi:two-component system cell cycle response regulator DivK
MSKVLVIEDYEDSATLIDRVLTARGHQVFVAADGESGLQMAADHKPDLILLDLGLPDIDGQTVASQMRRMPELARTPIVVVTAWPEETARKMVAVYECNGYISKPINNIARFAEQIASYLHPSS